MDKFRDGVIVTTMNDLLALDLSPDETLFREELVDWLADNLTDEFRAAGRIAAATDDAHFEVRLEWERKLAAARWLGVTWPEEYGGRGGTATHELIFLLEHGRSGAPYWIGLQGRDLFGPTLLHYGSDELKARFIPPIMRCEEFWGQGYSEPGAGSDLASLRTRAVRDGDEWVVDGQKIWCSFGVHATWLYVLCRTDMEARKHAGISLLLVPVDQPGVDIRPIRHMAGGDDFCEVFLDGARTSAELVVGGEGQGWKVAMGSLGTERLTTTLPYQAGFQRHLDEVIEELRQKGRTDDPRVRQELADAWIGLRITEWLNLRVLTGLMRGDTPDAMTSVTKLRWASWHRESTSKMVDLLGANEMIVGDDYELNLSQGSLLNAMAETIYGGTNEVQRSIIGERLLGLPREPS
jgi:alkylation response protein AidB-like acyl-CoA dehydrogenase